MLRVLGPIFDIIETSLNEVNETEIPYDEDLAEVFDNFPALPEGHQARRYTLDAWTNGYVSGGFDVEEGITELFEDIPDLKRDVNDAVAENRQRSYHDKVKDWVEEIGERQGDGQPLVRAGNVGTQVTLPIR